MWPFKKRETSPNDLSIDEVKSLAKILIIDNQRPTEIMDYLKKTNWHAQHLAKIPSITCKQISDSHIICVDIIDVGAELGLENGLKLIKPIKEQFPEKRILVYLSRREHDIFDDCIDLIDKKIVKSSSPLPIESAIKELAVATLNWNDAITYAYSKLPDSIRLQVNLEKFKTAINGNSAKGVINLDGVSSTLKVSKDLLALSVVAMKFAQG